MRLKQEERETIKKVIYFIDEEAKIFLFGSRVDDKKKGGDIDLLVLSNKLNRKKIRQVKKVFFEKFGEQRLDLIVPNNYNQAFVNFILDEAVEI